MAVEGILTKVLEDQKQSHLLQVATQCMLDCIAITLDQVVAALARQLL